MSFSLIYNFHLAEARYKFLNKNFFDLLTLVKRSEIIDEDLKKIEIYGKEAFALACCLKDTSHNTLFLMWKKLNKLWKIIVCFQKGKIDILDFEKYYYFGLKSFENGKYSMYLSSLNHLIKMCELQKIYDDRLLSYIRIYLLFLSNFTNS